jgi:hypothetical protein
MKTPFEALDARLPQPYPPGDVTIGSNAYESMNLGGPTTLGDRIVAAGPEQVLPAEVLSRS